MPAPLESLCKIANIFLIMVVALSSVVLLLRSVRSMRFRRYETGVLRAIDMRKAQVALDMVIEVIVMVGFCLAIGLGVGVVEAVVTEPVADSVLSGEGLLIRGQGERETEQTRR